MIWSIAPSYKDLFNTDWKNYYQAIFRCNQLIQADATINWNGDTKTEGRIMGEARAIRAILVLSTWPVCLVMCLCCSNLSEA